METSSLISHYCDVVIDGVSNHQPYECLLNCPFRRKSKKTSKFRVTGLCVENSPEPGEFPAQMASNTENVFIWWRHHGNTANCYTVNFTFVRMAIWHENAFRITELPEGNPMITIGHPWQSSSHKQLWYFLWLWTSRWTNSTSCQWFRTPWRSCDATVIPYYCLNCLPRPKTVSALRFMLMAFCAPHIFQTHQASNANGVLRE